MVIGFWATTTLVGATVVVSDDDTRGVLVPFGFTAGDVVGCGDIGDVFVGTKEGFCVFETHRA